VGESGVRGRVGGESGVKPWGRVVGESGVKP